MSQPTPPPTATPINWTDEFSPETFDTPHMSPPPDDVIGLLE